jgi:hypothetical protein
MEIAVHQNAKHVGTQQPVTHALVDITIIIGNAILVKVLVRHALIVRLNAQVVLQEKF